jgi:hypothetical protein
VAVEVDTTLGFTDVCFADGRPDRTRTVRFSGGVLRAAGELARYSFDAAGLRGVLLVNGTLLSGPAGEVRVADRQRTGKIVKVDYPASRIWVTGDFAADELTGQELIVENADLADRTPDRAPDYRDTGDGRRTSLTIVSAARRGDLTMIQAKRSFLISRARILNVDEKAGLVTLEHAPVCGTNPNRRAGLVFANEAGTRSWRGTFHDGVWRNGSCRFRLEGAPLKADSLADTDDNGRRTLLTWDLGVGDAVRLPSHVQLTRADPPEDSKTVVYEVRCDTAFTFRVSDPAKVQLSRDGKTWRPARPAGKSSIHVTTDRLDAGCGYVRLDP